MSQSVKYKSNKKSIMRQNKPNFLLKSEELLCESMKIAYFCNPNRIGL